MVYLIGTDKEIDESLKYKGHLKKSVGRGTKPLSLQMLLITQTKLDAE